MATTAIWKDTSCSIPHGQLFRISGGTDPDGNYGGVFYTGRAVSPTGSANATVFYNRLCAGRLHIRVPDFLTVNTVGLVWGMAFTVQRSSDNGGNWTNVVSTNFRPDWSYDNGFSGTLLNRPINKHFHPKQSFFYSCLEGTEATVTAGYLKGATWTNTSYNPMTGSRTAVYPLSLVSATGILKVSFGTLLWDVPVPCAQGALYYVNAFGGWDTFAIEGNIRETDDTQRWTRRVDVNNSSLALRGEQNYVSEITRRWTLHTGGLTDDESSRMWHLLQSNNVWLHNFADDTVLPVILEDGSQDRKTYRNAGRQAVTYTITARLAQERIRR